MNVDCQETQFSCREDLRVTRTVLQAYVESVDGGSPMYSVQVGNEMLMMRIRRRKRMTSASAFYYPLKPGSPRIYAEWGKCYSLLDDTPMQVKVFGV